MSIWQLIAGQHKGFPEPACPHLGFEVTLGVCEEEGMKMKQHTHPTAAFVTLFIFLE